MFVFVKLHRTRGHAFIENRLKLFEHKNQLHCLLVTAGAGLLGIAVQSFFHGCQIGKRKFGIDHSDVVERIHFSGNMHDIVVVETPNDMCDGITLANVGKELIAKTFTLARSCNETGDIDKFDSSGHDAFGLNNLRELLQAGIRHFNNAYIGFNGAERIVLSGDTRFCERVEDRGFADIGKADDAAFQAHDESLDGMGWKMRSKNRNARERGRKPAASGGRCAIGTRYFSKAYRMTSTEK